MTFKTPACLFNELSETKRFFLSAVKDMLAFLIFLLGLLLQHEILKDSGCRRKDLEW